MSAHADRSAWLMRAAVGAAVAIIVGVGIAAFVLSYDTLRDLAQLAGIKKANSWLFPVIVDGTIVQATVSVMVLSGHPAERRWFSWVLGVSAFVSVAGNSLHAFTDGSHLDPWLSAVIAAIAPVALLVDTHGVVMLFRAARTPAVKPAVEPVEQTTPEPDLTPAPETPAASVPAVAEPVRVPEPATLPIPAPAAVVPVRPVPPVPVVRPRPVVQQMLPLAIGGA
ncbi:DUF2637 domain-containing protein [Nocardia carnea]|uniref:DUF2637 domain-containing protein n=1 Tax=Nocardia carnea TaxID=37328 RepID=UPI002455B10E|nr:DUF2637 domain-containing protein [Nocardia carnea]